MALLSSFVQVKLRLAARSTLKFYDDFNLTRNSESLQVYSVLVVHCKLIVLVTAVVVPHRYTVCVYCNTSKAYLSVKFKTAIRLGCTLALANWQ